MGELQLEWKNHDKALSTKLWEFLKEEYLVDFYVTCHGQRMKVHKFVLALLFPMLKESLRSSGTYSFEQELAKDLRPEESSIIPEAHCLNLDNIADHAEDMNYLIEYAYTGKTTVPKEHADCLMHIAESMEIKSLTQSLSRRSNKRKSSEIIEQKDMSLLSKLRPRTQLKKIVNENRDFVGSDDDFDLHAVGADESSLDSIEDCDDYSDDDGRRKKKTKQNNRLRQKRHDKCSKETSVHRTNLTKTLLTKTNSDDEANQGISQEQKTTPTDNGNKNVKCDQCDYVAKHPNLLERHLKQHARNMKKGPKKYICKVCKDELGTKSSLVKHLATNCGTEAFACKYCGHKTHQKSSLELHMMAIHQVDTEGNRLEKNLKCPDCDFVCCTKYQLEYHARAKHERLNKFKCKECNYGAPYKSQVAQHERIMHQNRKDFMCEECGAQFSTSAKLNSHVLVRHKGKKLFKCHICSAEYSDRKSFKIHMQRHEGKVEYKFVCHVCGHSLRRKFELRAHLKKKHDMEMEGEQTANNPCQIQSGGNPTSPYVYYSL